MQRLLQWYPQRAAMILNIVTVIWSLTLGILVNKYHLISLGQPTHTSILSTLLGLAILSASLQIVLAKPYPKVYRTYRGLSAAWCILMIVMAFSIL